MFFEWNVKYYYIIIKWCLFYNFISFFLGYTWVGWYCWYDCSAASNAAISTSEKLSNDWWGCRLGVWVVFGCNFTEAVFNCWKPFCTLWLQ